ncbi:MAG: hypothetical protein ACRBDL_05280 [Alphaproteobacteria bacterium]
MQSEKRVWVVFTNQTDFKALSFLKPGYRHCFVIMHDGQQWISVDPMAHYMSVKSLDNIPKSFDFSSYFSDMGHDVVEVTSCVEEPPKCSAPPMFFTCVEVCKRVLGVHKFTIFTPWQLYQYLHEKEKSYGKLYINSDRSSTAEGCG